MHILFIVASKQLHSRQTFEIHKFNMTEHVNILCPNAETGIILHLQMTPFKKFLHAHFLLTLSIL
jgi:hypothetical protein